MHRRQKRAPTHVLVECDVAAGIEHIAAEEIRERLPSARTGLDKGVVRADLRADDLAGVLGMRTVAGAWLVVRYEGARPSVVLGDARLADHVGLVLGLQPAHAVRGFRVSASGSATPVMRSIGSAIARSTGLRERPDGLVVRLRPVRDDARTIGWEALVAVSPRPLAARAWRVRETPGTVNGPLAAAIVRLTNPGPKDRFLNFASGSATLAIERALTGRATRIVATDVSRDAVADAATNVAAAGHGRTIQLVLADSRRLPFPNRAFDVLVADLPWGHRTGSHEQNLTDYHAMLVEAARVATRRATLCVLTTELRLTQRVLGNLADLWRVDHVVRVEQGGARPAIYTARRA